MYHGIGWPECSAGGDIESELFGLIKSLVTPAHLEITGTFEAFFENWDFGSEPLGGQCDSGVPAMAYHEHDLITAPGKWLGADNRIGFCGTPVQQQQQAKEPDGSAGEGIDSIQFLDDVEQLKELASEAPIIKLVNQLIHRAVEANASDIHIEPFEGRLKVRYRIDGLLREVDAPPVQSSAAVISRIKIMADLNIAERRLAQDGRFKVRVRGTDLDLRISTIPTMYGESVVLRLLHRDNLTLDFGPLGFTPELEQSLLEILSMPHGILLVTGPTGSGKSTTLYAALKHLNTPERKILTVEDPVEYNIDDVNQIQVKPQIGLSFANALRSIVRQDPDVIMIGEMRDTETAKIAVQSALTGHLVFSTIHTNDAVSSYIRLINMGVDAYLVSSTIRAILAQRLIRLLCPHCKKPVEPTEAMLAQLNVTADQVDQLYEAQGCVRGGDGRVVRQVVSNGP